MDLSQFRVRSFVIGLIVLGVLITLASWGISKLYTAYTNPKSKVVTTTTTPTPLASQIGLASTPPRTLTTNTPNTVTSTPRPTATPITKATTTTTAPQTTKGGIANQPKTGSDDVQVQNPGIAIYTPKSGDSTNAQLKVAGTGNVTSGKITLEVLDSNGSVLGTQYTNVCYGTDACPFETTINYIHSTTPSGYLYAYTLNSMNQRAYEVLVPVNFN